MRRKYSDDKLAWAAFIAIVIFLGVNFVAVKFSNRELPPFWGASLRFIIASLLLFAYAKVRGITLPKGRALTGAALFGVCAFGVTYGLLYWALVKLSAGLTSVILATIPLATLLIAAVIGQERITARGLVGSTLAIIGIGIAFKSQSTFGAPFVYLLAAVGAVISAALSGIVVKHYPKSHPVATNVVAMAVGAVLLLIGSFIAGESLGAPALTATWAALGWLVTSSIGAFVLMVWVLSRWYASSTSYVMVLAPLVTVVIAWLLLNESVTADFLTGGAIVLAGVYISIFRSSRKTVPALNNPPKSS